MTTGDVFGMRARAIHRLGLMVLALAIAPGAALAQDLPQAAAEDPAAYAADAPPSNPGDEPAAETPLSADETAALGSALTYDPFDIGAAAPAKTLRLPSLSASKGLDMSRTDRPDGSSVVFLKQPLPTDWDAKLGADLGLASNAAASYQPDQVLPAWRDGRNSGAAWASLGVLPNLATVDARVDPTNDRGKLGTTFKHAVPLGGKFAVTLQNSSSVTETFSPATSTSSDLPLMAAPIVTAAPTPEIWNNEMAAKFDILPTGTAFGAKVASNSTDPVSHNTLSADQKIYGALHMTTAVTDLGQTTSSKSVTAGFKLNW
jgi:hypothetical protein